MQFGSVRIDVPWVVAACLAVAVPQLVHAWKPDPAPLSYPRGPWWREDINQVLLAPSQILISYEGALREQKGLLVPGEPNSRSSEEALALARALHAELEEHPERFEALARRHSDDPASAPWGGRLGNRYAPDLPDGFVDALGNLAEGEVSRVISSPLGLHILKRASLPAEEFVAGREVTIGYAGLPAEFAPHRDTRRSRAEALRLAQEVYASIQSGQTTFESAVERVSDSLDRAQEGYFGSFSSYSHIDPQRALVLGTLPVDGLALLDDPYFGVRLVQRVNPDFTRIASKDYVVGYRTEQPKEWQDETVTRTREEARVLAERLSARIQADPAVSPTELPCDHACGKTNSRFVGIGLAGLDRALAHVAVGEVLTDPIDIGVGWLVARRVQPQPSEAMNVLRDLPRPPPVSLETATDEELAGLFTSFRDKVIAKLELGDEEQTTFDQILQDLDGRLQMAEPATRLAELVATREQFQLAFGGARANELEETFHEVVSYLQGSLL